MTRLLALPRSVLIATGVLAVMLVGLLLTYFFLASHVAELKAENESLQRQLSSARSSIETFATDREFVLTRSADYERILDSDLLIPHTRRTALRTIQEYALAVGLTELDYEFDAVQQSNADAAARQVRDSKFRVNVENVSMSLGAPLDRPVYIFIDELIQDIPGTAVLKTFSIRRPDTITTQMLNNVAQGLNSGIISSEVEFEWRTAQPTREEGGRQ